MHIYNRDTEYTCTHVNLFCSFIFRMSHQLHDQFYTGWVMYSFLRQPTKAAAYISVFRIKKLDAENEICAINEKRTQSCQWTDWVCQWRWCLNESEEVLTLSDEWCRVLRLLGKANRSSHMGRFKRKMCLRTCAKCTYLDHHAHALSIIRTLPLYLGILWYPMILLMDREGSGQTAWMGRLIWAFAVRIWLKTRFRLAWSI